MNASIRLLLCLPLMGLTVACSGKDDGSDESVWNREGLRHARYACASH